MSIFGVADLHQAEYRQLHHDGAWVEASMDEERPNRPMTQAEAAAILERQRQIEALLRRPPISKPKKIGRICQFGSCNNTLTPEQRHFCSKLHSDAFRQRKRRRLQSARKTIAQLAPGDHALIASVVDQDSYVAALEQIAQGSGQQRKLAYRIRMTMPYTAPSAFTPRSVVEDISQQTHWQEAGYAGDPEIIACKLEDEGRHAEFDYSWALCVSRGPSDEDNNSINQSEFRGPHDFISVSIGIVADEATVAESIKDEVARFWN